MRLCNNAHLAGSDSGLIWGGYVELKEGANEFTAVWRCSATLAILSLFKLQIAAGVLLLICSHVFEITQERVHGEKQKHSYSYL